MSGMISVHQSAEALRMWLEPIEQILIDHGWTRVANMPNVWVNQKGETSFLAEALRGMLDRLDRAEKDRDEAVRLMRRLQAEDYNADSTNLRGAINAFLAERPTT